MEKLEWISSFSCPYVFILIILPHTLKNMRYRVNESFRNLAHWDLDINMYLLVTTLSHCYNIKHVCLGLIYDTDGGVVPIIPE